jgi:hypothetical protein
MILSGDCKRSVFCNGAPQLKQLPFTSARALVVYLGLQDNHT